MTIAYVTINDEVVTVEAQVTEELLDLVKDVLVNDLDERMDEIGSVLYDTDRGNSDCEIERMENELESLENEGERISRASSITNLTNLGYDITVAY